MNARSRKPSRFITCGTVGAILFVAGPRELSAQCEVQKLSASDAPGDAFGWAVSVGNDVAAVGAWGDDCGSGNHCGAAYVYRVYGSTWVEEQKLTASDAANGDDFGKSVSISDNVVLVGAPFGDCVIARDCGTAYVYRFNGSTWVQEKKLTASDAADNDWFGFSVCLSGDVAVVGAQSADCAAGAGCGAAYLYRFNSSEWVEEQKLTASDAAEVDFFGWSVSITRDVAVVGAPLDDCAAGAFCGAAYVYRFNGLAWIEEQKLIASDAGNNEFGRSVSASGNVAIVGAPDSGCAAGAFCGAAYVFRFNGSTWVEEQKLTASDANWSDLYGSQVSIIGNHHAHRKLRHVAGIVGQRALSRPSRRAVFRRRQSGSRPDRRLCAPQG